MRKLIPVAALALILAYALGVWLVPVTYRLGVSAAALCGAALLAMMWRSARR